jgi:6,7-dimethyl-8-ribityllumazine synthase
MSKDFSTLGSAKGAAKGLKIRIVVAAFNRLYTARLLSSAQARLRSLGGAPARVDWVPGALELPLAARWAAEEKGVDAVVALGCVIRGESSHYDLVCKGALDGLVRVGLESGMPVLFGVITVENRAQAKARSGPPGMNAGRHAAEAAVAMVLLRRKNAGSPRSSREG